MSIGVSFRKPGIYDALSATHRVVLKKDEKYFPAGGIISGAATRDPGNTDDTDKLRAGFLMGIISASSKWAASVLGVTSNAEADGSTSVETSAAAGDELVRRIGATGSFKLFGPANSGGIVRSQSVAYSAESAGTITVTALVNAFIAGSLICPTDGSEYMRSFIPDGYPMKVSDESGTSIDVDWPNIPMAGLIDSSVLLPAWPSDVSLRQWIMDNLRTFGPAFTFDHVAGL